MTVVIFSGLSLLVLATALAALRHSRVPRPAIAGVVLVYAAIPAVLAVAGRLDRYTPLPAPALVIVFGLTLATTVACLRTPGARLAAALPLGGIVAFQGFRIVVEWLLHRLYLEGIVPIQMTYSGRNGDIISGITGLGLGLWIMSGRGTPPAVVWVWNLLGLGLLANIVAVAVLSTPVPFRLFLEGPPNLLPSTFPWVWLPTILVQAALASHLVVFRRLLADPPPR